MTTLVDIAMTLSNARYSNDDQQVPDTNGVVVPGQQKASHKPRLPDFSSLLLEPQNNQAVLNTPDLIQSLDFGYQDQLDTATGSFLEASPWGEDETAEESIYDGIAPLNDSLDLKPKMPVSTTMSVTTTTLEPVRPTTLSLAPSQVLPPGGGSSMFGSTSASSMMMMMTDNAVMMSDDAMTMTTATTTPLQYAESPSSSTCSPIAPTEPFGYVEQERMEAELDAICRSHWIPRDPTTWNTTHVQKWISLVRDRYQLPETDHLLHGIDGTTLCMFSEKDFIQRTNASVGSFFHADLVWWKAACGSPMECNPPLSYTDLSASTPNHPAPSTVSSSNPNMYSTVTLSSPVMTQSSPAMTQSTDIPTPVLVDLELTKSTLYQINNEVEQQQQQHQQQQQQQQQQYSYLNSLSLWDTESSGGGVSSSCDSSLNSVEFNNALAATSTTTTMLTRVKQEMMDEDEERESDDDEETRTSTMMMGEDKKRYISHSKHTIHLWQFLKNLLQSQDRYGNYIKWLDQAKGIFKIENSREVAKLWGQRKNRPAMNYDKLSRSIRQYYKKGIIKKTTHSKRLVYQFQPTYL